MSNLFIAEYKPIDENTSPLAAKFAQEKKNNALWFAYLSGYWKAIGRDVLSEHYAHKAVCELSEINATFAQFSTPFQFTSWYMSKGRKND